MNNEQIQNHFQFIQQQIAALQRADFADWQAIDAALEDLQVIYEQMQTSLEAVEVAEEELFQQKQHYHDLFLFSPIAYLLTDANGLILEANQAVANLLNTPYPYLVRKPLAVFVAEKDRAAFRTHLNQLSQSVGIQVWRMNLCPCNGEPILIELHIAIVRDTSGSIERLRIGIYNLSQSQEPLPAGAVGTAIASQQSDCLDVVLTGVPISKSSQALDGLRVLIVDDEADIREFMTTVLEAHGIQVKTAASAATALEALEQFRPDVLLSDIRLPDEDGYSLIRRVRALETQQRRHLPAAAMTAYLDEEREKALKAGFEAHLYKLVHPIEWIETVAQLARQNANPEPGS